MTPFWVSSMGVLLLRLSGPLQSWGDSSRFNERSTRREPTKSGVIGLVASAMGRSRDDDISDLCQLEFGVRVDQPGELVRDFQTERSLDGKTIMPLSQRYYLSDAVFLVALGGDDGLLSVARSAIERPRWPLYLGRRSCPADFPILLNVGIDEYGDVRDALAGVPWQASPWYRDRCARRNGAQAFPDLEYACDGREGERCEMQSDVPLSFGKIRRYKTRAVLRGRLANPDAPEGVGLADESLQTADETSFSSHDPIGFL